MSVATAVLLGFLSLPLLAGLIVLLLREVSGRDEDDGMTEVERRLWEDLASHHIGGQEDEE